MTWYEKLLNTARDVDPTVDGGVRAAYGTRRFVSTPWLAYPDRAEAIGGATAVCNDEDTQCQIQNGATVRTTAA